MKLLSLALAIFAALSGSVRAEDHPLFAQENLVAWCIVPFDAQNRGPEERAKMLRELGLTKCAYDWRAEHVPTFEEEIRQYAAHGIEFFAFWATHEKAFALFKEYELTPQIWQTAPSPEGEDQENRVRAAAEQLAPLVEQTRDLGSKLGLYNHGGWGGEPENLVAVCEYLRKTRQADHVGIVYNFHHGHDQIGRMKDALELMTPYLLCLNLNGMNDTPEPKILPLGQGKHDKRLLDLVAASDYKGPIGILDHRPEIDAEIALRQNLEGLRQWEKNRSEKK